MIAKTAEAVGGTAAVALFSLIPIGWCCWLWMAIRLGSFGMFFIGMIPPFGILTAPIGLYSLLFGVPHWLLHLFT